MNRYLLVLLCLTSGAGMGQNKSLVGFENLKNDKSKVVYEQRFFRNPFYGYTLLRQALKDSSERGYIPLIQGVPFVTYKYVSSSEKLESSNISPDMQRNLGVQKWFPFKDYKFDFWLQPQFIARFGNFENPVESKTNILLNTQLPIARGFVLNTGVVFPIINDLDSQPLAVRLAPTYVNKFAVLSPNNFLSASAGFFYSDQYGINVQYRHANLNKSWSYGFEGGYSGYYRFIPGHLEYAKPSHVLLLADVAFRAKKNDITIKLSGGQFMHNDRGARVDFIRQFSKIEVAFFGLMTTHGNTIGFNFAIPIPPGNIVQSKRVRLRTVDEFRWEYIYASGYKMGEKPRFNYQLDERLRQYHLDYWKNQNQRLKQ